MKNTAGPAIIAVLQDEVDRLLSAEPDVRADHHDSVHQMRVATRRLRSILRSYRKVFHPDPIAEVREELRWLAGILGVARDAEVRAERFATLFAEYPDARSHLDRDLVADERAVYAAAHRTILETFDSDRYARLRTGLKKLCTDPPLRNKFARRPAQKVFSAAIRTDLRRLDRLVRAEPEAPEAERIELLHEIRKAAKRLRYCTEVARGVLDGPAAELSRRAKKIQSVLGDHRDAIEAKATISAQAEAARARGIDTSAYETLTAAEDDAARKALEQYP
ncbi:MAG: CHAD domain-containing protein, partial [Nocardia sp.]|nr:CHAD domain-containing protein [Nocardia sp.]